MNILTAVSSLMSRFANWKILITSGVLFLASAAAFFGSSLPFAIPAVTTMCGQPPPDVRLHISGEQVREFLSGCGQGGRAAYQHMQVADLFYPAISGIFLAAALALVLTSLSRPGTRVVALAAVPLLGTIFDYLENAAAWVTMTAYPQDAAPVTDLLGVASTGKQLFTWAAWAILTAAIGLSLVRSARRRIAGKTGTTRRATEDTDQQQPAGATR